VALLTSSRASKMLIVGKLPEPEYQEKASGRFSACMRCWTRAVVEITGPKVGDLLRDFCRVRATNIAADGLDILSVRVVSYSFDF
jgi:hypothetical protein